MSASFTTSWTGVSPGRLNRDSREELNSTETEGAFPSGILLFLFENVLFSSRCQPYRVAVKPSLLLPDCNQNCFMEETGGHCPLLWSQRIQIPWRRGWLPTLALLPEKFNGQWSLEGYSPWGRKVSDTTEC